MRRLFVNVLLILGLSISSYVCAEQPDLKEIRKTIDAANARYVDCFVKRDAKAFGQLFAEDAVVMEPGGVMITGRSKIEEWLLSDTNEAPLQSGTIQTRDLYAVKDVIYETGTFRFVFQIPGKEQRVVLGTYIDIWKEQKDSSWKIVTEVNIANE